MESLELLKEDQNYLMNQVRRDFQSILFKTDDVAGNSNRFLIFSDIILVY